jgi:hypothetical protein
MRSPNFRLAKKGCSDETGFDVSPLSFPGHGREGGAGKLLLKGPGLRSLPSAALERTPDASAWH